MCVAMERVYIRQRARELGCRRHLLRLWIAAGARCHWCCQPTVIGGRPNSRRHMPANSATIDHLLARGLPDRDLIENKVLACRSCNNLRHHKPWRPGLTPEMFWPEEANP